MSDRIFLLVVAVVLCGEGCRGPDLLHARVAYDTFQLPPGEQPRLGNVQSKAAPYREFRIVLSSQPSDEPTPAPESFRPRKVSELVICLDPAQMAELRRELEAIGFFDLPPSAGGRPSITYGDSDGERTVSKEMLRAAGDVAGVQSFSRAERLILEMTGAGRSIGAGVR